MPNPAAPSVLKDLSRYFRRSAKAVWRDSLAPEAYRKRVDTPKARRERLTVRPVPVLVDAAGLLGHPPRGRKGARPRHRCQHPAGQRVRVLEEQLAADAGIRLTHRCYSCGRVTGPPAP